MRRIPIVLFILFLSSYCYASKDTIYYKNGIQLLRKKIQYFEDITNKLDINKIISNKSFINTNGKISNFGVSKNTFWLKFTIQNNNTNNIFIDLEYPILNTVAIYKIVNNKVMYADSAGEAYPFYSRSNNDNVSLIFPLKLKKNETGTYYLKITSGVEIIVPIIVGTEKDVSKNETIKLGRFGIYIGIMISIILYNIFLLISTRDTSYLSYVIFIFFVGLTQATLNGYSYKYLWPEFPWIAERATHICGALSGISTIVFVKNFLSTKTFTPKFNIFLNVSITLYTLSLLLVIFNQQQLSYVIINVVAGIGSIMLLIAAVYIYKIKQYRPALFFVIAWSVFIISIIVFVLKDTGIIPYNTLTVTGLQIGSGIEALLLSFALADKINVYKREKEESQAQTLSALQENERMIKEQNVTLERNVKERTFELVTTNNNLNKTLTELKEAQSQLVEAEKMASLGQLTAGIAHEINNPINFVTSNVAPLRRDVDLLINVINNTESLALSDISFDEKQQQIEDYKEEIEFDFLKIEIDQLINGIHEGATRTADIVKGLKIFSRLDENDLKKADINECLQSTLTIANNLIGDKIQVIKNFADIPLIECYPGKLNQVFLNIISNAVFAIQEKFKNQAGGCLKVTTDFNTDTLFIRIEDNGTGMSEAVKKKIYEPFFTTKDVGVGTGLGMSIVYNTIKKHNGHINLDSAEGLGTTFTIELQLIFKELVTDYQSEQN